MSLEDEKMNATYLGDAAYVTAGKWAGEWELFTTNGIRKTNFIFLDKHGVMTLLRYLKAQGIDLSETT